MTIRIFQYSRKQSWIFAHIMVSSASMEKREEPQLDFAKAIREANELRGIGKITEDRHRQIIVLLGRAWKKPEEQQGSALKIAREVAKMVFLSLSLHKRLEEAEAKFDILLAECDKERLAGQQSREPPPQDPANQNPDPPITDKTP